MKEFLKNHTLNIGFGILVTIVAWAFISGRIATHFETQIKSNTTWINKHEESVNSIPVIQAEIKNIKENSSKTLDSVNRIEDILIKRK